MILAIGSLISFTLSAPPYCEHSSGYSIRCYYCADNDY